jgi:hypothetical protein
MGSISGYNRIDVAIAPSSYASATAVTSRYFNMKDYDRAIFIIKCGSMPSSCAYLEARLLQAPTSTAPTVAVAIGTACTIGSTVATDSYIKKASIAVLEADSSNAAYRHGDTIVINGITFTLKSSSDGTAAPTSSQYAATRLIGCSSNDTVTSNLTMTHLNLYLNHAVYGVPGLLSGLSGAASSLLTIYPEPMGEKAITITFSNATGTVFYPTQQIGYLECHGAELGISSSYDHVAVEVTPSTIARLGAVCLRGTPRYSPTITLAYDDIV